MQSPRKATTGLFTDAMLRRLARDDRAYTRSEPAPRGTGRLILEVLPNGAKDFYYRYRVEGADRQIKLGRYDPTGRDGITLKEARAKRDRHAKTLREHGDVKAHLAAEHEKQEDERRRGTLGDLCDGYVASLKAAGKVSARAVENALKLHVEAAHRSLWRKPAAEITAPQIRDILAMMVKAGRTRQVNIVRSYLGAAFAWGAKAEHDPRHSAAEGKRFALRANPVALVPRIAEWDRAGERALSDDELAEFWRACEALPAVQRDCLRFLLALGGQRATQLLRAPWSAYDFETNVLHLRDPKGRGSVRDHLLPLTTFALAQLELMRAANSKAPGPFSSDGETTLRMETLSKAVTGISAKLAAAHEFPSFRFGDLRRTCETTLARLGVSKDVRAWLLSHGRSSDVQTRHYDRNTYLPEKKAALELWAAHLIAIQKPKSERGAKVLSMQRRGKRQ